jgi:uncharacterized protein (UPF0335 family)
MIKTKKNNNEMVTKQMFDEGVDKLAFLINKSFEGVESRMAKQADLVVLTERVAGLEKEMKGMHGNFNTVFGELKAIRERLDRMEKNDFTVDIVSLDLRVKKLEKKVGQ